MRALFVSIAIVALALPLPASAKKGPKILIALTDLVGEKPSEWWTGDPVAEYMPPIEKVIVKKLKAKGFRVILRQSTKVVAGDGKTAVEFARSEGAEYVVTGEVRAEATGMSHEQGIQEVLAQVSLAILDTRIGDEHASASAKFRMGRADVGEAAAAAVLGAAKTAASTLAKAAGRLD